MKFPAVLLTLFLLWLPCQAQNKIDIVAKGNGVKTVEVDKQKVITINYKEKVTLITELPFTLEGPADAAIYNWQFPAGVTAIDKGPVLEVTAAAKGTYTVYLKATFIDFDKKSTVTSFGQAIFSVGELPNPPNPPDPPVPPVPPGPTPPADLVDLLKGAYKADGSNQAKMTQLAKVTAAVAKACKENTSLNTAGEVSAFWKKSVSEAFGTSSDLLSVRKAQATWLASKLPKDTTAKIDRQMFHDTFKTLSTALEEAMK